MLIEDNFKGGRKSSFLFFGQYDIIILGIFASYKEIKEKKEEEYGR